MRSMKRMSVLVVFMIGAVASALAIVPDVQSGDAPKRDTGATAAESSTAQGGGSPCARAGFTSAADFHANRALLKLAQTALWFFSPHDLPAASAVVMHDPLNINVHATAGNDPWTTEGGSNVWPSALNNIQFSSNMTPGGALTPRGQNALQFSSAGFNGPTNVLAPAVPSDGLTILCDTPTVGLVQAMLLNVVGPGTVQVSAHFDPGNGSTSVASRVFSIATGQTAFIGFIKTRIHRIDLWNTAGGSEGVASIALYRRVTPDCGDGNGIVGVPDLLAVINQWGQVGTPCDRDGDGIGVPDLLAIINAWGPVQTTKCLGENPSFGNCASDADCFPGLCEFSGCTRSMCICNENGGWICTDDCCGHCTI